MEVLYLIDFIWLLLMIGGVVVALITRHMEQVSEAVLKGAENGVNLALALIAANVLWMGLMHVPVNHVGGLIGYQGFYNR